MNVLWAQIQYLEELEVLTLPALESTGSYFIVSAADSLACLDLPSFRSAGGAIAGRAFSLDGPWSQLVSLNLPVLASAAGNVYVRPNLGTTPLVVDLSSLEEGQACIRALGLSIGSSTSCNFPITESITEAAGAA
jgi:hypothetical protein